MYSTTYVSTLSGNANMALSLIQGNGVDLGIRSNPNNKPFGHSASEILVSSLSKKAIFACRLARLLVYTMHLDAGMTCECHALGRRDTIDRHSADAYMTKAVKGFNAFFRHNEFAQPT
jgi:hypothetical protein